jgi:hypothetical protein
MNKQTKELFNKALDQAVPETWTTISYEQMTKLSNVFAELIVRECQLRVEQYINECGEIASIPDTVIMKHFGVELDVNETLRNRSTYFGNDI